MKTNQRQHRLLSGRGLICLMLTLLTPALAHSDEPSRANAAACLAYAVVVRETPAWVEPAIPTPPDKPFQEPTTYRAAYLLYKTQQRPMVVMISAAWCPYCPAMKRQLLQLKRDGKLPGVSVVIVDHDQDRAIAGSVLDARKTLPALSVYHYVSGKAQEARPRRVSEIAALLPAAGK